MIEKTTRQRIVLSIYWKVDFNRIGVIFICVDYDTLESSVRDSLGGVVWSHKIQEKQADIYHQQFKMIEVANISAASLTTVGVVSLIFTDQLWIKLASALISFVSIFASAFLKSFDLRSMTLQHKVAANKILLVREDLKLLLLEIVLRIDDVVLLYNKYERLIKQLGEIYSESPGTTKKAVSLAKVALGSKQDNTFSNEEIDTYLPISLRRGERNK